MLKALLKSLFLESVVVKIAKLMIISVKNSKHTCQIDAK